MDLLHLYKSTWSLKVTPCTWGFGISPPPTSSHDQPRLDFALTSSLTSDLHEVTSGSALVFHPSERARALKPLACGSVWIKALHYRKRKQHMLSLFYMELNGFPLMHACVNVRFPSAVETRVTTHTHNARGQDGHPHICPRRRGFGGVLQGQTVAKAGMAGTMEGCGVLF